jgi:hypothetical protein
MAAVVGGAEVADRLAMMTLKTYCGAVRISSGRLCRVANKSQSQREHALAAVRATRIRVLIATDIAARGIDIEQVTHVVNYELLDMPERHVHRIGRTARTGATGAATIEAALSDETQPGQQGRGARWGAMSLASACRTEGGSPMATWFSTTKCATP